MPPIITETPLAISVGRLKQAIQWFPQTIFNVPRQTGKTQALLELIHGVHDGNAVYMCSSRNLEIGAQLRYRQMFPEDAALRTITDASKVFGKVPVYIDEWCLLSDTQQRLVMERCSVIGRVQTGRQNGY